MFSNFAKVHALTMSPRRHDLEAKLRFLSPGEGGRKTQVKQGYRADFRYLDDPSGTAWMIHPCEFTDEAGEVLPEDSLVFSDTYARMYILSPNIA